MNALAVTLTERKTLNEDFYRIVTDFCLQAILGSQTAIIQLSLFGIHLYVLVMQRTDPSDPDFCHCYPSQ